MAGSNNMPTEEEKEEARLAREQAEREIAARDDRAKLVEQNQPKSYE